MRKRILSIAAGLFLAAGITVAVAAPASANFQDCVAGNTCGWSGVAGTGTIHYVGYVSGGCYVVFPGTSFHSVYNRFGNGKTIFIYTGVGCQGNTVVQALTPNSSWSSSSVAVHSIAFEI